MGSMFGGFGGGIGSSQNRLMDYAPDEMEQHGSFSGLGTGGVNQGTYRPADLNPGTFSGVGNGQQPQTPIAQKTYQADGVAPISQRPYQPGSVAPVAQRQPPVPQYQPPISQRQPTTQQYQPPIAQRQAPVTQGQPPVAQGVYRPQPQTPVARRPYQSSDRAGLFQSALQRLWGN